MARPSLVAHSTNSLCQCISSELQLSSYEIALSMQALHDAAGVRYRLCAYTGIRLSLAASVLNCLLSLDAVAGLVRLARATSRSHARPLQPPPNPEWLHQRRRGNASTPVFMSAFCMHVAFVLSCQKQQGIIMLLGVAVSFGAELD